MRVFPLSLLSLSSLPVLDILFRSFNLFSGKLFQIFGSRFKIAACSYISLQLPKNVLPLSLLNFSWLLTLDILFRFCFVGVVFQRYAVNYYATFTGEIFLSLTCPIFVHTTANEAAMFTSIQPFLV